MDLFFKSGDARFILPYYNENIFRIKTKLLIMIDNFNMREPLVVR